MHDGYIFTLGICGVAADSHPAPALLDALMAALPPVKRAAFLGDVLPINDAGAVYDPLLEPIINDIADAETVLIVAPLRTDGPPARLIHILEQAARSDAVIQPRPRFAVLVGIASNSDAAPELLAPARDCCDQLGIAVASAQIISIAEAVDPTMQQALLDQVRHVYLQARARYPDALP